MIVRKVMNSALLFWNNNDNNGAVMNGIWTNGANQQHVRRKPVEFDGRRYSTPDVLQLNLGGQVTCAVTRQTLCTVPGSLLEQRFGDGGRWDEKLEKDRDGNFFLNVPADLFLIMINHIRHVEMARQVSMVPPPTSPTIVASSLSSLEAEDARERRFEFYRLVEYYGMTPAIYPVHLVPLSGMNSRIVKVNNQAYPPLQSLQSLEFTNFLLCPVGHDRNVTAYEIVVGEMDRVVAGWVHVDHLERLTELKSSGSGAVAVGSVKASFGLDAIPGVLLVQGSSASRKIILAYNNAPFHAKKGTLLRVEHAVATDGHLRWYADGKLLASTRVEDRVTWIDTGTFELTDQYLPVLSARGDLKIHSVELDCP